jgi:hypothetical protein
MPLPSDFRRRAFIFSCHFVFRFFAFATPLSPALSDMLMQLFARALFFFFAAAAFAAVFHFQAAVAFRYSADAADAAAPRLSPPFLHFFTLPPPIIFITYHRLLAFIDYFIFFS